MDMVHGEFKLNFYSIFFFFNLNRIYNACGAKTNLR